MSCTYNFLWYFRSMSTKRSPYCQCLFFSSNAIARALTKMAEEAFSDCGFSPSHAFILMTVNRQPGINAGEIASTMELTPSTVTRLVEKLEKQKLLERKSSGKFTQVFPTEQGKQMQGKLSDAWNRLSVRYNGIIGKEKGQHLSAYLTEALVSIHEEAK